MSHLKLMIVKVVEVAAEAREAINFATLLLQGSQISLGSKHFESSMVCRRMDATLKRGKERI